LDYIFDTFRPSDESKELVAKAREEQLLKLSETVKIWVATKV
jgi:hypothetical protein